MFCPERVMADYSISLSLDPFIYRRGKLSREKFVLRPHHFLLGKDSKEKAVCSLPTSDSASLSLSSCRCLREQVLDVSVTRRTGNISRDVGEDAMTGQAS